MAHQDLWLSVLKRIRPTIQKTHFITWFQNTLMLENNDGVVKVGLPTTFAHDWVSKKYDVKILQAFKELDETVKDVRYEIVGKLSDKDNKEGIDVRALLKVQSEKKVRKVRKVNEVKVKKGDNKGHVTSQMLNDRYTLGNFIISTENSLPHAACKAVANMPGGIYNPLYIYGNVGLGKTHLIQAVGNEILKNFPDMVVKYITAERFVNEVVDAIGRRHMKQFKAQYRNVDCFLIDDVQFFARKDSSQQEFFHTFNDLYDNNKQIILTSDRSPNELDELDERLTSRFGMGMVIELLVPSFETRVAILNQKCQEYQVIIDPEVLHFVATNVDSSVRELEGVLKQLVADYQLENKVPSIRSAAEKISKLNKAKQIIGYDLEGRSAECVVRTSDDVMKIVAEYFDLSVSDLVGKDRHKEIMIPRQICMYLIKNELNHSYEKIGTEFGGRNHTTVMHACNKTSKQLQKDLKLVKDINAIRREMGF